MPAYARSFELQDEDDYEIGAPVAGPGEAGTYTKESGFLSYYEVRTCALYVPVLNRFAVAR